MLSGGLDSSLAIKVIQEQGIEVLALHFLIPFVKHNAETVYDSAARKITEKLGCDFKVVILANEYLDMVKDPKHGYGKNFNPCIDCKILMLKCAKKIMAEVGASFVITGEVLGQRPMSQHRQALSLIEEESGLEGLILRPLSAKLLPLTIPESKGWVKRDNLLDIQGRSRKIQIGLADKFGIEEYPWPGGGCLLTEPNFSKRLKDIIQHKEYCLDNVEFLKVGRHFRLAPKFKLIVGRDEKENQKILNLAQEGDFCFEPKDLPGPTGIGRGELDESIKLLSSQIIARYTSQEEKVDVLARTIPENGQEVLSVKAIGQEKIKKYMI